MARIPVAATSSRCLLLLGFLRTLAAATVYSQALRVGSTAQGTPNVSVLFSASPLPLTPDVLAWAEYNDTIMVTGWATLAVHTREGIADIDAAYAAGFLEGATTTQRSWEYLHNAFPQQTYDGGLGDFVRSNFAWVRAQVAAHPGDAYWHHVGLVHEQWEGLYAGYSAFAPSDQAMEPLAFYSATLSGDLDDLNVVFPGAVRPDGQGQRRRGDGHCSILVKAVGSDPGAPTDLLASHTTWSGFSTMTRIYKLYDFPWTLDGTPGSGRVPATRMAFSSYPAALFSDDDWYLTSARLAITETTIANNNASLWAFVQPESVLEWARNTVANRLAASGPEWVDAFSRHNSGTYNNEWHIIDYKLFTPGRPLRPGTLWVLDQFPGPGNIVAADHTGFLAPGNQSYWASYNRVSVPRLIDVSNQTGLVQAYGDHFTYENTSRARIFRRDQGGVVDEASLRRIMRYNDFEHDPLSVQGCADGVPSASNAIAERGDLTPPSAACIPGVSFQNEGATDAKYTNAALAAHLAAWAQSGPTYDTQPAFDWATSRLGPALNVSHVGQPDRWAFPWVLMDAGGWS